MAFDEEVTDFTVRQREQVCGMKMVLLEREEVPS